MNRITAIFQQCRAANRAALVIFAEAGYPTLEQSEKDIDTAIENGADIIELGIPFSDPMADGPVIAAAGQDAIKNGANLSNILEMAARIRLRHPETGMVLFSYYNVMYHFGLEKLCGTLQKIGVDGILAVDLPLEEREELLAPCRAHGLHLIPLISPATGPERAKAIVACATGFVYYVSVRGITGARSALPPELAENLGMLRKLSPVPVVVGFGIASREAARQVAACAEGVVVGSAFVSACGQPGQAAALVRALRDGCAHE
ncbi:MAG: tryptophan synthase subunit alpha [Victivallales bacterium]|nr:tryptophan synthase subunit alpha [Victivallales bacterium]